MEVKNTVHLFHMSLSLVHLTETIGFQQEVRAGGGESRGRRAAQSSMERDPHTECVFAS
jgi:hypothetical protein